MRLFIAEKPSVGRAIAEQLNGKMEPQGSGRPTHYIVGNDIVTWCVGHILAQADPDAYDAKFARWKMEDLPILPQQWKLIPVKNTAGQLAAIKSLLPKVTEVINCGDPDREGQLLVDEVLDYLGNKKPVSRMLLSALDEASIKKSLADIRDNKDFFGLYQSALGRSRADWIVGMNLTRAFTLAAQKGGYQGVLSVGRVQTPTLAMMVSRDLEIENFVAKDFFEVTAENVHPKGQFKAKWRPAANAPYLDEDGRCLDKAIADNIAQRATGATGKITKFEKKQGKETPPLPWSLAEIQVEASRSFGYSAQQVLDTCQALYETHKMTTYPRTDCRYLPESQHADSKSVLAAVAVNFPQLAKAAANANGSLKSAAFNDKKVTAHHAIVPTGKKSPGTHLSSMEQNIYELVCRSYVAQFYPDHTFQQTSVAADIAGESFTTSGRVTTNPGWKVVYTGPAPTAKPGDDDDVQSLPDMAVGDAIKCSSARTIGKKTTPPQHYTDGTLIKAMTNVHQMVSDPEIKKRLKETAGIGTEATRASIIETLLKRGLIAKSGKKLVSTDSGKAFIKALPNEITSPGLTAMFEQVLESVEHGVMDLDDFIAAQSSFVSKIVDSSRARTLSIPQSGKKASGSSGRSGKSGGSRGGSKSAGGYSKPSGGGYNAPAGKQIALKVPFDDKDEAKALGARWNPDLKAWCISAGTDQTPFAKWMPSGPKP